jgi:outer membrane murein-binding lipoprotein Lpp
MGGNNCCYRVIKSDNDFSRGIPVRVRAIVAVIIGAIVLTGCSETPKQAGSAVIVNGKVISAAEVSQRVDKVRAQIQDSDASLIAEVPSLVQITQRAVDHYVLVSLLDEVVKREDIDINDNQVASYRDEIFAQYTQAAVEAQLVSQNAVPADDVDGFMYEILVQRALIELLAPGADTQTRNQALIDYMTDLSKEVGVELNPRYGTWDPSNLMSKPGDSTLAVPLPQLLGQ